MIPQLKQIAPMPEVLSASDHHRVVLHRAGDEPSEHLIVTFAPKSDNFGDEGFGTRFALKQGHDTVYVAQTRFAWHQAIDHEDLAALILPVAAGRGIVAYGTSAGGYAALYFGGALDARIMAFSPRNDIHPLISVSEKLTREKFRHRPALDEVPKSRHRPVCLFDPHQSKDSRLVHQWAAVAYPDALLHPVFGTGHNTIGALQRRGVLSPMAKAFFNGVQPDPVQIWEEGSHFWHVSQAHDLKQKGHLQDALSHLLQAWTLESTTNVLIEVVRLAKQLGDTDTAAKATAEMNAIKHRRRTNKVGKRATAPIAKLTQTGCRAQDPTPRP